MGIRNVTKKMLIAPTHTVADTVLGRAVGLMFSLPSQSAMVLKFPAESVVSLHMFFVFYPIDVLFVDSHMRVVEMTERFMPFTTYSTSHKAKFVVEAPAGAIRKSKTRVGDTIAFFEVVEQKLKNSRRITVRHTKS